MIGVEILHFLHVFISVNILSLFKFKFNKGNKKNVKEKQEGLFGFVTF